MATTDKVRFKFFIPDARVLNAEEVASLPPEKKAAAEGKEGVWIDMVCPDKSCVTAEGDISVPAVGKASETTRGTWLNLFCPEGSCEVNEPTDVP